MPEGKKPAEDLYSAKTHLHQPVPEVSTVNATALPADAPEGALPSEVRPEIVTWEKLCEAIKASGKAYNMEMITKAYDLANKAHNGVCRRSGEPYICHPLAVARLVLDLGMDSESIAAALLHDVVEDTPTTLEDLTAAFGEEVALLVDGVTISGTGHVEGDHTLILVPDIDHAVDLFIGRIDRIFCKQCIPVFIQLCEGGIDLRVGPEAGEQLSGRYFIDDTRLFPFFFFGVFSVA